MTETKVKKQRSYFTTESVNRYVLDDEESFIEHKPLDEGLFQKYQDITSKIKFDREGETTELDMALGAQRQFLLENLTTGWNLVDESGKAIKFSHTRLFELPPDIITGLLEDIYKSNKILAGESDDDTKE